MSLETTYAAARANLDKLCDQVAADRIPIVIRRPGGHDVVLVSADELTSLIETAHLLRSPRNRDRLLTALHRAKSRKGRPQTPDQLRREVGLGKAK